MKLCFVVSSYPGGGIFSATLPLCAGAVEQGHDVTLLFMRQKTDAPLPKYNYRVETLGQGTDVSSVPTQFLAWVEKNNPDAIIFSGTQAAEEAIPYLPPRIRCIIAVHDASDKFWESVLRFESNLDAVVTVSNYVARRFQGRLSDANKLFVIHNALEIPCQKIGGDREGDLYFAGGGNLLKGPEDLLKLWPVLLQRGFKGRLHWLGHIPPHLEQRIAKLPEASRVICYGMVPHSKVYEIGSQSKVHLLLSRSEACPMVLVEASLSGCLTVAWDIDSGHQELMSILEMPYLAEYPKIDALADTISQALEEHSSNVEAVAHRAQDTFNVSQVWAKYESMLNYAHSREHAVRDLQNQTPPAYRQRSGYFQFLPTFIRHRITQFIFRSPRLAIWLRNKRGI